MNYNYEQRIDLTKYIIGNLAQLYVTEEEFLSMVDENGVLYNDKIMLMLKDFVVREGYTTKEIVIDILKKTNILISEWLLKKEIDK